ncbi:hypothetical protein [Rickettsia argasii]|uniref:Uncharacterized protein n=1 Tax=Rickettsia argasii T170-B TaxID=1268837 RepID=A0A0F3RFI7_9RICK|nr:hypothetical protein [Rickettsia argasii]KJW03954.1 hypothetical protein RAT170B_1575 [Rickettsia argasii T170-B]
MTKRKLDCVIIKESIQINTINKKKELEGNAEKGIIYQASSVSSIIYSDKNIKSLLKSYLPNANIEDIYLFKVIGDHVYYNFINNLKAKLIHETKDKIVSDDKFYVIIEQSINSDLQVSSAIILKLYNKNNKNQIKILPVLGSTSGSLLGEFLKTLELSKVLIKVDSIPDWFRENQSINVYLENLIEVIKLSIEHKSPSKIPNDKIIEIMNTPYAEYEKIHQGLLNRLELTDDEGIDQLSLVDKNQDEFVASSSIKKTVSWDPTVEDNEGHTIRRKKHKFKVKTKEKDEVEEYFEQCITSWNWDQKIWEERYFNTNKLDSDKFQYLLDKYCDQIRGAFGSHISTKHHYDRPECYHGCGEVKEEILNKIIEGYIFLINCSPNLLNLFREYQESMLESFSQCDIDMLGFYKAYPELKLINLIEKRIDNIDVDEKDQNSIIIPISDDKTDTEILVDITNYNQENSELKLTGDIVDSYE